MVRRFFMGLTMGIIFYIMVGEMVVKHIKNVDN
jgi:hypothetical protein